MPKLPRITSPKPVNVAPEVTEFNDLALTVLVVRPHANDGVGTASMRFLPYDYETETLLEDPKREVKIDASNFQDMLTAHPAIATMVDQLGVELGKLAQAEVAKQDEPDVELTEPTP